PGRLAQGPDENSGRAGRIAGLARVVISMSPILTDGLRPVGRAWPARQKPGFALRCKTKFLGAALSYAWGLAARPRMSRRRMAVTVPTAMQRTTPTKSKLLTVAWKRSLGRSVTR